MRACLLLVAALAPACLDPTQITVDIRTSYPCGDTNTGILAGGRDSVEGTAFSATQPTCAAPDRVGKLVVVPSRAVEDEVHLRVLAGIDGTTAATCVSPARPPGTSCIEARRILRFVQHRKLELPIVLDRSCINVRCPERQSCDKGVCRNAVVTTPECIADPTACPDAGVPPPDAGRIPPLVRLVAAGFDDACAVREADDAIFCWGANGTRQLGPNGPPGKGGVTQIPPPAGITGKIARIAIGRGHVCATDGTAISCWGEGGAGQLGRTLMAITPWDANSAPVPLTLSSVGSLVAGAEFTCAIDTKPFVTVTHCFGAVLAGTVMYSLPDKTTIGSDPGFVEIAAGSTHVCGYTAKPVGCSCPTNCSTGAQCNITSATTWCWGDNSAQQTNVGLPMQKYFLKPYGLTNLPVSVLGAGFAHSGAWGVQGGWLWGGGLTCNLSGTPSQIAFTKNEAIVRTANGVERIGASCMSSALSVPGGVVQIAAGGSFACALTTDKKVYCWGTLDPLLSNAQPTEIALP